MCYIYCKSIHAATPAGMSLKATFNAVLNGENPQMQLRPAEDFQVAEPVMASLFDRDELIPMLLEATADMQPDATLFERLCVWSAREALKTTDVDPAAATTLLIISTTKGNVGLLNDNIADHRAPLSYSAEVIAKALGNPNEPITVSNACVSGVSAIASACSLLTDTDFTNAIVVGCDLVNRFIISGFQSFKALSQERCRPYDADRCGLNLGEAVATFILSVSNYNNIPAGEPMVAGWSQHNDANHISGPSRSGEGMYRVLNDLYDALPNSNSAFLGAIYTHGTATLYNDEMEAIAINRAGLADVPVSAVKNVLGHTLGAAGLVETALAVEATRQGIVLPTHGFARQGTSVAVNVSAQPVKLQKPMFFKILSGFGGTNAGIAISMKGGDR